MLHAVLRSEIVEENEEGLRAVKTASEEYYLSLVGDGYKRASVAAVILSVCDDGVLLDIYLEVGFDIYLLG